MSEDVRQEEAVQEQTVSPEQAYLNDILQKFNINPEDESLKETEKLLLSKIQAVQKAISEASKEIEQLNEEIRERQEKGNGLVQKLVHLQGQSQGYVDSLLALR